MLRTRFSFACSVVVLTFSAMPADAQSAPAPSTPTSGAFNARINDIQVARDGDTVSILVKLSQQPGAATVKSTGETLTLEVDGLTFNALNLSPPAGSLMTRVEAASGKLTLSGAAFSNPTTVIYRNAVMIEAKLAEPKLQAATSLLGATIPSSPQPPAAPQAAPTPAPVPLKAAPSVAPLSVASTAPVQPVAPKAVPAPAPEPLAPVAQPVASSPAPAPQSAHPTTATPIAPTPAALTPAEPAPHPKHEAADQLQSHPVPAAAAPATAAAPIPTASIAGIDAARCTTAAAELVKDAWALAAMGDHALCLIDGGKLDEAKNRLDQLAAITPQDWRVALGRATLAEAAGDTEAAQAAFISASRAAPNEAIRVAIVQRVSATPDDAETDIELPLPTLAASKN